MMKNNSPGFWNYLLMAATLAISGCGSKQGGVNQPAGTDKENTAQHEDQPQDSGLTLNNGAKWKADSVTNVNVGKLREIIAGEKPVTLEDYHAAGKSIRTGINQLLQDCRMQGPDHEALHQWLKPLLDANNKLLESQTPEEAARQFAQEQERMAVYSQYFE